MVFLYFIYEWLIFMPLFILTTIITATIVMLGCRFGNPDFWGYYPGVIWGRIVVALALCPCKVEGKENLDPKQSYVFVANHQGAADIPLLFGYLGQPFRWMLRKGIMKIPFMGKACDKSILSCRVTSSLYISGNYCAGFLSRKVFKNILKL